MRRGDGYEDMQYPLEESVEDALVKLGYAGGGVLGAAVSGGADSSAMLVSLCRIARRVEAAFGGETQAATRRGHTRMRGAFKVRVITINHNIRDAAQSAGDASSVVSLCEKLSRDGYPVSCRVETFRRGLCKEVAKERGRGEEEAARFLRYEAFRRVAREEGIKYVALAHNQNDQIETILMHFLCGTARSGIAQTRTDSAADKMPCESTAVMSNATMGETVFIRPMLDINRQEIESYLALLGVGYREDSTNKDTKYFRNKIRNIIMPVLDTTTPGYQKALLSGISKSRDDEAALNEWAESVVWIKQDADTLYLKMDTFQMLPRAIKVRVLLKAFNALGVEERVPYKTVSSIADIADSAGEVKMANERTKRFKKCYAGVEIGFDSVQCVLYAKKIKKAVSDSGFCVIIESAGKFDMPLGSADVREDDSGSVSMQLGDRTLRALRLPFCVRSCTATDRICVNGGVKRLSSLMSGWRVAAADRMRIPIIAQCADGREDVACVWGSTLGYKDCIAEPVRNGEKR